MKDDNTIRPLIQIFDDLIQALDEAIATYWFIESIDKSDSRPNQLLFCHIVNRFDSFVQELLYTIILTNKKVLKNYFKEQKKIEEKISIEDAMEIIETGLDLWIQNQIQDSLDNDITRKRHAQKLEMLMEKVWLDHKNIFVYLNGSGMFASWCLKNTPAKKKTVNHKTTPENIIGYADFTYEKRNSVTHNRNNYLRKTIDRLNTTYKITIENNFVIIRINSIKSVIRFCASVWLKLLESEVIKTELWNQIDLVCEDFKDLINIRQVKRRIKQPWEDERFINWGITNRRRILTSSNLKNITIASYMKLVSVDYSTARRDIKVYEQEWFLIKKKEKRKTKQPIKYLIAKNSTIQ